MQIIPAVNCHEKDFDCVKQKVHAAETFAEWIHLDVADGIYTYNKTFGDPLKWEELKTKLNLEVHLMVERPEMVAEDWFKAGAKRVIVHAETLRDLSAKQIGETAKKYGAEAMLTTNPETPRTAMAPYEGYFSGFQVLAVHPGLPGQRFLPTMLEKVKSLRNTYPTALIEVDGGITEETAVLAKKAGANALVAASFIYNHDNPAKGYKKLVAV